MNSVNKSKEEWQKMLTQEQYQVLREGLTEPAFTGQYYKHQEEGFYYCAGCDCCLFSSEHKYDSGTGWPSFFKAFNDEHIGRKKDFSLTVERIEVHCFFCKGHLGHWFEDGPYGERFCINSIALTFKAC